MLSIEKLDQHDIYELKIDGKVEQADIEKVQAFLEQKAADQEKILLLAEVDHFPSFRDFKSFTTTLRTKFRAISAIGRYAVVSDNDWIEAFVPVGNFLTPQLPVKHFDKDEKAEAIDWLINDSIDPEDYFSKLNIEHIRGTNIYTFVIDDEMDLPGMKTLHKILTEEKDKVRFMAILKDFEGFDSFKAVIEGIRVDFAAFGKLEKYAIVTDKGWVEKLEKVGNFLSPGIDLKVFKMAEQDIAMEWLKED
ncbi:MAG: STAS/SEC14 domain-containing protein [Saprospiraceae bacterium]|nr:STAS/SEC14 domain-containing protein [Saprospiraceae bacterium]